MVKIDLITGFLGSGKTTFIKKYAKYLMDKGLNIGILENDYGAVNVDMMLLGDLEGDKCELEMISGGCDADTHKRRFRTKLIAMGMCGYDRVIVEPSGIYDVDEFFDTLKDEPLDNWYEIGNVITIMDAAIEDDMSETADYLLASEASNAGVVILSHADMASEEQIKKTVEHLNRTLGNIDCKRRFEPGKDVISCSMKELTDAELDAVYSCGYMTENYRKMQIDDNISFKSLYFMNTGIDKKRISELAGKLLASHEYGEVFRVKGFVKEVDGWCQINATHNGITVDDIAMGQDVLIVIGENLKKDEIEKLLK